MNHACDAECDVNGVIHDNMMANFNQAFFASASSMVELSLHSYKAAPVLNQNHWFYSPGIIKMRQLLFRIRRLNEILALVKFL